MPRKATGLTALTVRTAKPGRYGDGHGLYLLVRSPEARYWIFRFTRNGRMREMGLGRAGADRNSVSLSEARKKCDELQSMLRNGIDPLARRDDDAREVKAAALAAAARATTFKVAAEHYINAKEAGWRNAKHSQQWRNTLATYAYPHIGDLPVGEIVISDVQAVLDPIWSAKPETAGRVRGRIEAILDYARVSKWRDGENPARWKGNLAHLLAPRDRVAGVRHHAALPWKDAPKFLTELRRQPGVAARALEFLILTAARTGEVIGAKWSEIDLAEKVWTLPPERMKSRRQHRVPLTAPTISLIEAALSLRSDTRPDAALFPGSRPGSGLSIMAMTMVLRRMSRSDITVHGFRSTFRDWASDAATTYPREVAEAALAHALNDKTEAAYRRTDLFEKRRRMMEDWVAYCSDSTDAADTQSSE